MAGQRSDAFGANAPGSAGRPSPPRPGRPAWFQTAPQTARKSAPASTRTRPLSGVMPPIATQGISNRVDHQERIDGSGRWLDLLGRGREEGAEGDIIRARLPRLHREVAAVMGGDADLGGGAEQGAGLARVAVVLAEMDAVGADPFGQRHRIVDDEGDVARRRRGAAAARRAAPPRAGRYPSPGTGRRRPARRPARRRAGRESRRRRRAARSDRALRADFPARVMLGTVAASAIARRRVGRRPVATMRAFLDGLDAWPEPAR